MIHRCPVTCAEDKRKKSGDENIGGFSGGRNFNSNDDPFESDSPSPPPLPSLQNIVVDSHRTVSRVNLRGLKVSTLARHKATTHVVDAIDRTIELNSRDSGKSLRLFATLSSFAGVSSRVSSTIQLLLLLFSNRDRFLSNVREPAGQPRRDQNHVGTGCVSFFFPLWKCCRAHRLG